MSPASPLLPRGLLDRRTAVTLPTAGFRSTAVSVPMFGSDRLTVVVISKHLAPGSARALGIGNMTARCGGELPLPILSSPRAGQAVHRRTKRHVQRVAPMRDITFVCRLYSCTLLAFILPGSASSLRGSPVINPWLPPFLSPRHNCTAVTVQRAFCLYLLAANGCIG